MSDYLDPNNEELLKDFFVEAQMQVDLLEQNILVLENDPQNKDSIDEIFRAAHTLKGASATVQMNELAEFTHILEDVLDDIRSNKISVDGEVVDVLLESIDIIKAMLDARTGGDVYSEDISETADKLRSYLGAAAPAPAKKAAPKAKKKAAPKKKSKATLSEYDMLELKDAAGSDAEILNVEVKFDENNPMNTVGGIQVYANLKKIGKILKTTPDFEELYEDNFFPVVHYYAVSDTDHAEIEDLLFMPDVTLSVDVSILGHEDDEPAPAPKAAPEKVKAVEEKQTAAQEPVEAKEPEVEESEDVVEEVAKVQPAKKAGREGDKKSAASSILRVDSRRIDNLLNLVSEAVINKASFNQIGGEFQDNMVELQSSLTTYRERMKILFDDLPGYLEEIQGGASVKEIRREITEKYADMMNGFSGFESSLKSSVAKFRSTSQNLGRITGDLQEGVMRIRMVPISQIFSRFPRLVRDLSKSLKKKINLRIEGEETELDKSVIEDLLDPLIHCVRNSIDHGIEDPEVRVANGKSEDGTVILKASNEGNMILIEVQDDGAGIDVKKIRQKAIDRGVIHPNKVLSDVEAFNLIFDAGFSTAGQVTNISGRGVGLDVVKKQIEKLNGSVSVWSEKGTGTKFTIKLPLTLAIIQGLLVRVGTEKYAIPITSVIDSHRIKPEEIKRIDNYEVFNVREDVVSLLRLNRLFMIETDEQKDYYFVVIVGSGDNKMGLIVDSLIGEEDVVIKPLRDKYTNVPGIAGANITGDGTVSLIIDVGQLLELGFKNELEARQQREATIR